MLKKMLYTAGQRFSCCFQSSLFNVIKTRKLSSGNALLGAQISSQILPPATDKVKTIHKIRKGPGLEYFIANDQKVGSSNLREMAQFAHPYVHANDISGEGRRIYIDVFGCQMNVNDTEIVWSILRQHHYKRADTIETADIVLIMTCSIREGAEQKIWNKLNYLHGLRNKRKLHQSLVDLPPLKVGILGCMAERLKEKWLENDHLVDIVAGPDSYRDLPLMLSMADNGRSAINVLLSLDETYADVTPVSLSSNRMSAYVSIMRGCDNMCTYCIVPFTRGRERSRPLSSIIEEIRLLSDQGVKEVTLLGQNVNSYRDTSELQYSAVPLEDGKLVKGFKTVYKNKRGGIRFAELLDHVSQVDPEIRIRFISPHPKDFPDEVLQLIAERENICSSLHLPAQSGNSRVLELMRRGYTREAYLDLVSNVRSIIPSVSLSSDFICGFCSETESEFDDTISLVEQVGYNNCFIFSYSLREKTPAHRRYVDDIPADVKLHRTQRLMDVYRQRSKIIHESQIGERQLVLVEGNSRRSEANLAGRNDGNTKVIIPKHEVINQSGGSSIPQPGDYLDVLITNASSQVLHAKPLSITSLKQFSVSVR